MDTIYKSKIMTSSYKSVFTDLGTALVIVSNMTVFLYNEWMNDGMDDQRICSKFSRSWYYTLQDLGFREYFTLA